MAFSKRVTLTQPAMMGGWRGTPRNNLVGGLGDSLTVASIYNTIRNYYASTVVASHLCYSLILPKTSDSYSDGLFLPGTVKAISGYSTTQIRDLLLPQLLAVSPLPGFCLVTAGTNDLGSMTNQANVDSAVARVRTIYETLIANKIIPIAAGIPTCANATNRARVPTFNAGIEAMAAALSAEAGFTIPYMDTYALTDNGVDGWIATYSSDDDVHWGPVGAAVVGQAIRDDILELYTSRFAAPDLVTAGNDTGGNIIYENGTMIDDANTDGIPDGGNVQGSNWTVVTGGADTVFSLAAEPGVVSGNWWRMNKTAHTADLYLLSGGAGTILVPLVPGATYEVGCMMKVLSPNAASSFTLSLYNSADGVEQFGIYLTNLAGNVAPFKTYKRFVAPGNANYLRQMIKITGGTGDLYVGQLTVRKIT